MLKSNNMKHFSLASTAEETMSIFLGRLQNEIILVEEKGAQISDITIAIPSTSGIELNVTATVYFEMHQNSPEEYFCQHISLLSNPYDSASEALASNLEQISIELKDIEELMDVKHTLLINADGKDLVETKIYY